MTASQERETATNCGGVVGEASSLKMTRAHSDIDEAMTTQLLEGSGELHAEVGAAELAGRPRIQFPSTNRNSASPPRRPATKEVAASLEADAWRGLVCKPNHAAPTAKEADLPRCSCSRLMLRHEGSGAAMHGRFRLPGLLGKRVQ